MKRLILFSLFTALAAVSAQAQELKAATLAEKSNLETDKKLIVHKDAPNEISSKIGDKPVTYSGILVQCSKSGNPLEMVNPVAPKEAGDGDANVAVDPVGKKPRGLALFRLRW